MASGYRRKEVAEIIRTFWPDDEITQREIANALNEQGLLTKRGVPWSQSTVSAFATKDLKLKPRASRPKAKSKQTESIDDFSQELMAALGIVFISDMSTENKALLSRVIRRGAGL